MVHVFDQKTLKNPQKPPIITYDNYRYHKLPVLRGSGSGTITVTNEPQNLPRIKQGKHPNNKSGYAHTHVDKYY